MDNFEQLVKIPAKTVDSVEVGYTGIPVCISFPEKKEPDCQSLLHLLNADKLVIAVFPGYLDAKEFAHSQITEINGKFSGTKPGMISKIFRPGIVLEFEIKDGRRLTGKLLRVSETEVQIQKSDTESEQNDNQNSINPEVIPVSRLVGFRFRREFQDLDKSSSIMFAWIPGLPQIQRQENLIGYSLLGLSLGLAGYGIHQNQKLRSYSREEYLFLPVENQVFFAKNPNGNSNYKTAYQNSTLSFSILSLLVAYQIYESYFAEKNQSLASAFQELKIPAYQTLSENHRNPSTAQNFLTVLGLDVDPVLGKMGREFSHSFSIHLFF